MDTNSPVKNLRQEDEAEKPVHNFGGSFKQKGETKVFKYNPASKNQSKLEFKTVGSKTAGQSLKKG